MTETRQQRDERRLDTMLTCGLNAIFADAQSIASSDEAAGMVTVPRKPTNKMLKAGEYRVLGPEDNFSRTERVYNAMLAAYEEQSDG